MHCLFLAVMLFFCLSRAVFIVKGQEDFVKLSGSQNSYLAGSINLSLESPATFENVFLDCVGHQISSKFYVFGAVSGAMIRNCTFRLEKQFATTIDGTTLTNVTIVTSESNGCQTVITSSYFYGVRIYTNSEFATNATSTLFVGCSLGIFVKQSDQKHSLIGNMTNCTVYNCFLNASIAVNAFVSVAGLTFRATDLLLLKSRFVSNITALVTKNDSYNSMTLSGCVMMGSKTLTIKDCDFLSTIHISGRASEAGGVLASSSSDQNLSFHNLSSYLSLLDSLGSSCNKIGNVVAYIYAKTIDFKEISTFSDIRIQNSGSDVVYNRYAIVSGLIANGLAEDTRITQCFASGTFDLNMGANMSAHVAGYHASSYKTGDVSAMLQNVCFSGEIHVSMEKGTGQLMAGGIIGSSQRLELRHSQVYGNISATKNSEQMLHVAGLLAFGQRNVLIDSCHATTNITVTLSNSKWENYIGGLAATVLDITNSLVSCNLSIAQADYNGSETFVGLLSCEHDRLAENCSAEGSMVFKTTDALSTYNTIGGMIGSGGSQGDFKNLVVRGSITAPEGFKNISTAFGSLFHTKVSNTVVAVEVLMQNAEALAYTEQYPGATVVNLLVDCDMKGNAAGQEFCKADLTSESAATELGEAFAWNESYNGGYPYPNMLPVLDANRKYVLPDSGDFSAPAYFVDDAGLPFPKVDFQPCRGVCYGIYSSPVVMICDDAFEYCVDIDRAVREFPGDSCIADNAVCNAGASFCSSEAEMLVVTATSERACQKACPGCYNGRCSQSKCVCDIYNEGDACTHNCRADEPNCFGNDGIVCDMQNASCIPTPSCENMTCVHGGCVDHPIANCECNGLWVGNDCDSCRDGFDPATDCEKCKNAMDVIDGDCACGQAGVVCEDSYFCSSGTCQKGCMLLDKNCTSCSKNQLDLCGGCIDGLVLKNGLCVPPKKSSIAAIAGGVVGGCVAIAVVGVIVFFVLKSRKANGESSSKNAAKAQLRKDRQMKSVEVAADGSGRPLGKQQAYTVTSGGNDGKADP